MQTTTETMRFPVTSEFWEQGPSHPHAALRFLRQVMSAAIYQLVSDGRFQLALFGEPEHTVANLSGNATGMTPACLWSEAQMETLTCQRMWHMADDHLVPVEDGQSLVITFMLTNPVSPEWASQTVVDDAISVSMKDFMQFLGVIEPDAP